MSRHCCYPSCHLLRLLLLLWLLLWRRPGVLCVPPCLWPHSRFCRWPAVPVLFVFCCIALHCLVYSEIADHASILCHVSGPDPGRPHGRFVLPMLLLLASASTGATDSAAAAAASQSASAWAVALTPLPGVVH